MRLASVLMAFAFWTRLLVLVLMRMLKLVLRLLGLFCMTLHV